MQKIAANCRCEGARGKTGKYFGFDIDGCSEVVHIFRVCSILVHLLILEFICQNKELCILQNYTVRIVSFSFFSYFGQPFLIE